MRIVFLLVIAVMVTACKGKKSDNTTSEKEIVILKENSYDARESKELLVKNCYLCHSPIAPEVTGRIAPPMAAIKARYINMEGYSRDEFIQAVGHFVENPTAEKALMYGAVKKFGVMPKQIFPKGTIEKIAAFMYDYQIDEPEWFKSHWEGHGNSNYSQMGYQLKDQKKDEVKTYADIGLEYALETKKVLGKNLMGTIQKEGTEAALAFCNIQAMPLTDSMSVKFDANIKRVSDKNRNPNNKANEEELKYIAAFKANALAKKEPKPIVIEEANSVHFYFPIPTNTMCLQCHGTKDDIRPEVQDRISKLYPNDLATGYKENEIRGIWSITFNKKMN
ncbi:c-type heme family protein [Yeosuana marina]|uniref:c-type heme family protein n=1 Tax=Yeosuana marina TaxID=1565536 RepID=UPI0030C8A30A